MTISKGVKICAATIIVMGAYNLIGVGRYNQFALFFQGINQLVVKAVYVFTIFYGICGIYCGAKILRLEDWARKVIVILTSISIITSLALNKTVMSNFRAFLLSDKANVPPEMVSPVYRYTVIFTALVFLFEIFVVYFFTRRDIIKQFK